MRKKAAAKVQKKVKKSKEKNPLSDIITLKPQESHEVFLYETTVEVVQSIIGADEYAQGLVKLRSKFDQEIQELSRRYGVEADVRVLLTLRNTL